MVVSEKDFQELYINGGVPTTAPATTPEVTPPIDVPTTPTSDATDQQASIDEAAALAAQDTTPPTDVPTNVPTDVPTDVPVEPNGELPGDTTGEEGINGDELQRMLDALGEDTQAGADTTQEIKTAAEEIKKSVDVNDTESQAKIDGLITKVAELETKNISSEKTIEILKTEYDKVLGDKLNLEYGSANDSKLVSMINESPELKDIISATMLVQKGKEGAKDALIQAHKTALENLTGQTFDSIIATKKVDEVSAMSAGQDAGTETSNATTDPMYVA